MGNGIEDTQPPHGEPLPEPDDEPNGDAQEPPVEGDPADEEE